MTTLTAEQMALYRSLPQTGAGSPPDDLLALCEHGFADCTIFGGDKPTRWEVRAIMFPQPIVDAATAEVQRLSEEIDLSNADHVTLWLESNLCAGLAWMAVRIVEAHAAALYERRMT